MRQNNKITSSQTRTWKTFHCFCVNVQYDFRYRYMKNMYSEGAPRSHTKNRSLKRQYHSHNLIILDKSHHAANFTAYLLIGIPSFIGGGLILSFLSPSVFSFSNSSALVS